jgi:hypothetical protein
MVCLQYLSPLPVGRRGVIFSFKLFLPAVDTCGGGGGSAPCGENPSVFVGKVEAECRVEAYPNTINYWTKLGIHEPEMLLNK